MIALDIWVMDLYIWIRWSDTAAVSNKIYFVVVQNLVTFERLRDSGDSVSSNSFHRWIAESSKNYLFFGWRFTFPVEFTIIVFEWLSTTSISKDDNIIIFKYISILVVRLRVSAKWKIVKDRRNFSIFDLKSDDYSIVSKFQGHPCRSFYVCKVVDQSHRV